MEPLFECGSAWRLFLTLVDVAGSIDCEEEGGGGGGGGGGGDDECVSGGEEVEVAFSGVKSHVSM